MDNIFLLLVLLLLSGFFSGAEIAIFSIGPERIAALKRGVRSKAQLQKIQRLETLKTDPYKLLVTILLGNNVVNVASSALATVMATSFAESYGFGENQALVIGVVTGVMTFLLLLFGEITPKSLAHKYALSFSLFAAPILSVMQIVLFPIIIPLAKLVKTFSGEGEQAHGLTEDELKAALELSEKEGKIKEKEKEWLEKILELEHHTVENVMTPRSKIFALPDDASLEEVLEEIQEEKYSRIPIYHDELDHIIGILTVHALLERVKEKDFLKLKMANFSLLKPLKIPITMKIDTLLREFQKTASHMALVYDEHGGLVGLITLEDVLEEIFGEIHDEQDEASLAIKQVGRSDFWMKTEVELEQLENFIRLKLEKVPEYFPWEEVEENKTVGLFLLEKWEKFPQEGECLTLGTLDGVFRFEVLKANDERIEEIRFSVSKKEKD